MRLTSIMATTNEMMGRIFRFTREELDAMAVQAPGLPVSLNFDSRRIGEILSAEVVAAGLRVFIEVDDDFAVGERLDHYVRPEMFAVPAVTINFDGVVADGVLIADERNEGTRSVTLTEASLTRTPADQTVTPLGKVHLKCGRPIDGDEVNERLCHCADMHTTP